MTTFDRILPSIKEALSSFKEWPDLVPFLINRDLNGRVRIVLEEKWQEQAETANRLAQAVSERLGVHGFPADRSILYEPSLDEVKQGASCFEVDGFDGVTVVDRLAVETDWSKIAPVAPGAPRIVFFSIKGGVGRSTASAVAAWSLAQSGKRVMVLDLDLESPGLSSSLLPETAGLPMASRTGWWRTWWITAQQCSKIWSPGASFLMTERSMSCRHMERIRESMSPNSEGFGCRRSMSEDCGKTGLCV